MKKLFTLIVFISLCNAGFSQAWKSLATVPDQYARGGSFSIGGKGYVFGAHYGNKATSYDPSTDTWTSISPYPASTTDGVVGCSLNGLGYAGTGTDCCSFTNSFFSYDPVANSWTPLPNFPGAGRAYAVMFAVDGKIYIGGGESGGYTPYHDFYAFDPSKGSWDPAPIANCPAMGISVDAVAFVIGDNVYVGTGDSIAGSSYIAQKDFWKYDTTSKVWTPIATFPGVRRGEASAFATCDEGFVGLGYEDAVHRDTSLNDFWQYDPSNNNWTRIADYGGVVRSAAFAFTIGKTGYVGSGDNSTGAPDYTDMWSYTPTATPSFTVASASSRTICAGQSVTFNDTSNFSPTNWQWIFKGGTPGSSTLQNPVIRYDTVGIYDVTLSAWNACDSGSVVFSQYITVGSGGTLTVTANPSFVCSGQPSTLSVSSPSGSYQWSPASGLTDSTSSSIVVHPDTTTSYTVKQAGGGNCASTGKVVLTVGNNTIGGHVTAIRDTICQGTPGNLSLSGNSSNIIQWQSSSDNNIYTDISGASNLNYKTPPLQQSAWYHALVGTGNCSATSDSLMLYVPLPLTAYFKDKQTSANVLSFDSDSSGGNIRSYHWDFGDGQNSTENNPTHTYTKDTTYYVCLTLYDGSNCSYTFCRYSDVTDGVPTISAAGKWVVYPDPFSEQLTVSSKQSGSRLESIEMYDVLGQLVLNKNMGNTANTSIQLDVSSLAKGMYYVVMRTANADYVQKVVKQ